MSQDDILQLIEKISPHAKNYVYDAFKNKNVEVLYSIVTENNKGIFIKVDNIDCCIFYAIFLNEDNIEDVFSVINNNINEYITNLKSKELCFNIYGENIKIISLARKLGFKLEMNGFHLEYIGEELPLIDEHNLIDKGFENSMISNFVDLFDSSYYQLNIDNGWELDSHYLYREQFIQKLNNLNKCNQVRSFWLNNELVGAYIFEQNYITDIVVKPTFQNKGYGSYILAHCIKNMIVNKSIKSIRLRVAKSNIGAKKLYKRNNFIEIACFAEHVYSK